ncbi:hypothetical protein BDF22DRAFT_671628 [Syncephalis plumigaleata]|nr:hypothetical protein BDF22DRAFT_671628 [Syncephalis plumigaleata]
MSSLFPHFLFCSFFSITAFPISFISMSHCHHEHHHHGEDHSHDDEDAVIKDLLYEKIDRDHVRGLNESVPGAAKAIIKPWHERHSLSPVSRVP